MMGMNAQGTDPFLDIYQRAARQQLLIGKVVRETISPPALQRRSGTPQLTSSQCPMKAKIALLEGLMPALVAGGWWSRWSDRQRDDIRAQTG